jgi:hypothetical protein
MKNKNIFAWQYNHYHIQAKIMFDIPLQDFSYLFLSFYLLFFAIVMDVQHRDFAGMFSFFSFYVI